MQVFDAHHRNSKVPAFVFHLEMADIKANDLNGRTLWQPVGQNHCIETASDPRHLAHVIDSSPRICHVRSLTAGLGQPLSAPQNRREYVVKRKRAMVTSQMVQKLQAARGFR
jgi:hypothetical protein